MDAFMQMTDVHKTYSTEGQTVHALKGISLRIERGEFVAVIGNSGSGKSTLMNLMGCLDIPTRGSYRLAGSEMRDCSDERLSKIRNEEIGFVFQGFNLIPSLSAAENVELPLMYRSIATEKRKLLSLEALDRVGLSGRIHHRPGQMSGGQQQRVAIARAIAARPPIILADEPTGNLDSRTGADIMAILGELWREGRTIVLITHSAETAACASRTIRIHDGEIVEDRVCRGIIA